MTKGILYGVGVGPGDEKLITVKAIEAIENADIIAVPYANDNNTALDIASKYIHNKEKLHIPVTMSSDKEAVQRQYAEAADIIVGLLNQGKSVAYLTLGDPAIYSTFAYIYELVENLGGDVEIISGVTSFCAGAAALKLMLAKGDQTISIIPSHDKDLEKRLSQSGTKIIMKCGSELVRIKDMLKKLNIYDKASAIERIGMKGEKVYHNLDDMGDDASYFSTIIIKDGLDK